MFFATRRVVSFIALLSLAFFPAIGQSHAAAQYTLLHGFAGAPSDGANPQFGSLATDGTMLYGLTLNGGVTNKGTLFKISTNGSGYQILHSFTGLSFIDMLLGNTGNTNDGVNPYATPLLIGSTLYGTTLFGGTNGYGTVFKINTDGSGFQLLHHFSATGGYAPQCTLVTDGTNLYGMTTSGGLASGTIFSLGTNGSGFRTLHSFTTATTDGNAPQGSLIISGGTLYGMTQMGGIDSLGTIFRIGTGGSGFQVIHTFTDGTNDGGLPYGSLILSGSTLYGMASEGGANNHGAAFSMDTSGSGFTVLHSFSVTETWAPKGDLTLANSTLYGMTSIGGNGGLGSGTIFQVNTDGSGYQILHTFFFANPGNLTDGSLPYGSLLWLNSNLYGMTQAGGSSHNAGALFSFGSGSSGGGGPVTALRVNILPAGAVKAGAGWAVNAGPTNASGTLLTGLNWGAHVLVYKAIPGWTAPPPQIVYIAAGVTNTFTGTYVAADITPPTLTVTSPTSKTIVNSNLFTATGTASDNVGVALVYYQLNGGAWTAAASGNSWTNWSAANLNLAPGPNVIRFYAKDLSGNVSATNSVTFTFVVSAPIAINLNPPSGGSIKPALNGQLLQIGKAYSLSVKATKGYVFLNWSGATNSTSTKLTFGMASNLTLTANFKDITRPVNVILTPAKGNTVLSGSGTEARGRAMDNTGVTAVWCQLNGGTWFQAYLSDGTNWQTIGLAPQLLSGPNTISAYAVDAAGNASLTNTIAFNYQIDSVADWAPDSLNGIVADVTPASGPEVILAFDRFSFSQTSATNSDDPEDYGAGGPIYLKTATNRAQLSLAFIAPPTNNVAPMTLVFTNHYTGYFTNDDGDTGGINLQMPLGLAPVTVAGKTLSAVSTQSGHTVKIKWVTANTFTGTGTAGSSSGFADFTRVSPVCGVVMFLFQDPANFDNTAYLQLTFSSGTGGTYFMMFFDPSGVFQKIDIGNFTM
jgi:uncharacterized repeat protein (TIGR03803 family)